MSNQSIHRRDFMKMVGLGTAAIGFGIAGPKVIGKTENGVVIESPSEFGGFLIEEINNKNFPYEYDPRLLKRMSEKSTTFSRNIWEPERKNRPELIEDLTFQRMIEGKGKIPNQTRLDYALIVLVSKSFVIISNSHCFVLTQSRYFQLRGFRCLFPPHWIQFSVCIIRYSTYRCAVYKEAMVQLFMPSQARD